MEKEIEAFHSQSRADGGLGASRHGKRQLAAKKKIPSWVERKLRKRRIRQAQRIRLEK
jgi:hypothetical protein